MKGSVSLDGVHILLTYKCTMECEHCFVWGSPKAAGTFSTKQISRLLKQAKQIPTVTRVYFEGGEPFLFYPILLKGVEMARREGFEVGIVSNAYWGTDKDDAALWLGPLAKSGVADLSLSSDEYHGLEEEAKNALTAIAAAKKLAIPVAKMEVKNLEFYKCESQGNLDAGDLMFRGRASKELAGKVRKKPPNSFTTCPEEPPGIKRVHVDAYGNVQFCQGITIGNVWKRSLKDIMESFDPEKHPIIGPLMRGGPAQLAKERGLKPKKGYADACQMCYDLRCVMRERNMFPSTLRPNQAYGVYGT